MRPPIGVAILGFFALVAGIGDLMLGFQMAGFVVFGPGETGSGLLFWGLLTILVGVGFAAAAFALWSLQVWGWLFANLLAIFGLINAVFVLLATGSLTYGVAAGLLPVFVFWYLNQDDIKAAFAVDTRGS